MKQNSKCPQVRIIELEDKLEAIQFVVDQQANDPALWLPKCSITEAYHQQEMRNLHAVIEGKRNVR